MLFAVEHEDLLRRFNGLLRSAHSALRKLEVRGVLTLADARVAIEHEVERWFPGGWRAWYDVAKTRGEDEKQRLARMVATGEFVW